MEEKKLTDEEIAKAILQSIEYSKTITYFDEWGNCKAIMMTDILDLIHRLQSENERLTRESDEMFDRHAKENQAASLLIEKRNNEIAELQKQVDELKAENTELYKEHTTLIAGSILQKKQAVKDTVKEIYDFAKGFFTWDEEGFVRELKELVQGYGVEVE